MPHAISTDGLRIHFETGGSGAPVLLLHPNHATCRSWVELGWFDALASAGLRALALDARGFGESDQVTTARDLLPDTSTEDIKAVLRVLDLEEVHLCGFSLGSAAALRFAVDMPERVQSVVLGGLGIGPLVQMGLFLGPSADDARRNALAQLDRVTSRSQEAARYFALVREVIETVPLAQVVASQLSAPILGIAGETDPQTPTVLYQQLRELGVPIQVQEIRGVGHGTCFSDARFREAAIDFLAALQLNQGPLGRQPEL